MPPPLPSLFLSRAEMAKLWLGLCCATMLSLGFRWHLHGQASFGALQPGNAGSMCVPLTLCCWGQCLLWWPWRRQPCRRGKCGARALQENMLLLNPSSHLQQESISSFCCSLPALLLIPLYKRKTIIWKDLFEKSNTCKSLQAGTSTDNWTNGEHDGEYRQTQWNVFIKD